MRWTLRLLAAGGALLTLVLATPLVIWWSTALARPWETASSGTLIVLSGPSAGGGTLLADSSYWRALYTVRAWRQGRFERVLSVGRPSAAEIALFLVSAGIPRDRISVENQSQGTRENALAVQRLASGLPRPLVLLTSDFHVYRALRAFRKAGLDPHVLPFPDGIKRGQLQSWYKRLSVFSDLVEESVEIARYRWRGWI